MAAEDYFDIGGYPYGPESDNNTPDYLPPYVSCPKCGGKLVERTRRMDGHKFIGCSSYPRCNFTCRLDETWDAHHAKHLKECEDKVASLRKLKKAAETTYKRASARLLEAERELEKSKREEAANG